MNIKESTDVIPETGTSPSEFEAKIRNLTTPKPYIDWKTVSIIFIMVMGFPVMGWFHFHGIIPAWLACLLGCLLMNLSFTAWHEPTHQNLSKSTTVNNILGWLASFASVYPGYFARRREHLIHHRWEGQDGMDPVYKRIQTDFWDFPLNVFRINYIEKPPLEVPDSFCTITPAQKLSDSISNFTALGVVVLSILFSFWQTLLWVWIVPRIVIFVVQAYYICFYPHHIDEGGYQIYRVRNTGWLIRFLTVEQSMHGIHHIWPWIPWHKYKNLIPLSPEVITKKNIQVV
jgi:beta-carotene hydroxylase